MSVQTADKNSDLIVTNNCDETITITYGFPNAQQITVSVAPGETKSISLLEENQLVHDPEEPLPKYLH